MHHKVPPLPGSGNSREALQLTALTFSTGGENVDTANWNKDDIHDS